jgi:rRNA biogenesis protein RRP5
VKLQSNGKASSSGLKVSNGFDWSGNAPIDPTSDSDSESEEENLTTKSTKSKGKSRAIDLTASSSSTQPQTSTEFERALLASPNSSFLWIQYMSFHLQLHEIDQARKIGRMALERINYREEEEKLNVWMALVNLEIGFGTPGTMDAVFKEAAEFNDKRTVYLRYAEALQAAGKENVSRAQ